MDVAQKPDSAPVRKDHGEWLCKGERHGVLIAAYVDPEGKVIAGYPIKRHGDGVVKNLPPAKKGQ